MNSISEQTLGQLVQQHGTPLWVYDAALIRERIGQLSSFDTVRFAQKACSNIHLLQLMREAGAHVDAVSLGEIERALKAGFSTEEKNGAAGVVFTCDLFDRPTLARVVELKIEVNAGSIDMLRQLGEVSPGHRVWLRINPGFGHGHSNKTNTGGENSKHGIWHTELKDAIALIRQYGLHLVGLHMHIGSGVDYSHLEQVCGTMVELVAGMGQDIEAISTGGGLSVPYREGEQPVDTAHYFALWDTARKQIEAHLGHPVRVEIEPGRFLVAEAGLLVTEVRATVVGGPLCESGDVFTQLEGGVVETRLLPQAQVGDYVVMHGAGAYGSSMSSNYNSRPHAAEYLVDGAQSRLIRRRQTVAELIALEVLG